MLIGHVEVGILPGWLFMQAEKNSGPLGLRPKYGADYFAAFVIIPDGYELEVKIYF